MKRRTVSNLSIVILLTVCGTGRAVAQQFTALESARGSSVVNTPHNLSAGGPGSVRASSEQQVCIFCHTPHHASSTQPLWNRRSLPGGYTPYRSTSLDAQPGQPTGPSKLCLSCHCVCRVTTGRLRSGTSYRAGSRSGWRGG
jgi:hypothetical protein